MKKTKKNRKSKLIMKSKKYSKKGGNRKPDECLAFVLAMLHLTGYSGENIEKNLKKIQKGIKINKESVIKKINNFDKYQFRNPYSDSYTKLHKSINNCVPKHIHQFNVMPYISMIGPKINI